MPQAFLERAHRSPEHTTSIPQDYHQRKSVNSLLTGYMHFIVQIFAGVHSYMPQAFLEHAHRPQEYHKNTINESL